MRSHSICSLGCPADTLIAQANSGLFLTEGEHPMPKISLRAYNREIESLIDQNQFDQAIAHARHILKFYPKHVHTYRLLGKAYLENQRYGDAADLFQRVLSAVPDDFVSNVGMSIIREDEGNLDEAIWHMERAFEVQPANSTIQKELRRLYGRRDGLEPPKVRLTRGALARMYIKGELYPQAIAELRAALAEDPQRSDLLTLLAQAYFAAGMRVEAAEVCSTLLKKNPYNLEGNRLLAEILTNSERADEAQIYRQRVYALDPYAAFTSPSAPTPDKVPDATIMLEKLVWSPGQPLLEMPAQPDWATSLGVQLDQAIPTQGESTPEWLEETPIPSPAIQEMGEKPPSQEVPPLAEEPVIEQTGQEEIPAWMKEAGWQPASPGEESPPPIAPESEIASAPLEGLAPAEIPEWLQAIAPPEPSMIGKDAEEEPPEEGIETPLSEATATLPWLDETPPGATDSVAVWLSEEQPPSSPESIPGLEGEETIEIPDWLKDLEPTEPVISAEQELLKVSPFESLPEIEEEAAGWPAQAGLTTEEGEIPLETEEAFTPPGEASGPAAPQTPPFPSETGQEDEEALAWLEGLAAKQGVEEGLPITPEDRSETPPEWEPEVAPETQAEELIPSATEKAEIPDWLKEAFESQPTSAEIPQEAESDEEMPEWLQQAMAETPSREEPIISATPSIAPFDSLTEEPSEAIPDWLRSPENLAEPVSDLSLEPFIPPMEIEPSEEALPAAAEEAIPEEIEIAKAEIPPWLAEQQPPLEPEPSLEMPVSPQAAAAPQEQPTSETLEVAEEESPLLSDTQPMRLRSPREGGREPSEIAAIEPVPQPTPQEGEMPSALAEEEIPEWLRGLGEEPTSLEAGPAEAEAAESTLTEEQAPSTPLEDEAAFAWLESLAARQGADEALLLKPEERLETPPEWVQKAMEEAEALEKPQAEMEQAIAATETAAVAPPAAEEVIPASGAEGVSPQELPEAGEGAPELPSWLMEAEPQQIIEEEAAWAPPTQLEEKAVPPLSEIPAHEAVQVEEPMPSPLNVNEAGLAELERLPGVGFIRAQAIITYRQEHGALTNLDDLLNIPGFDPELVNSLKQHITFGEPEIVEVEEEGVDIHEITLVQARNALIQGDLHLALTHYQSLIKAQQLLSHVIQDLTDALYRFPVEVLVWQSLGDAYLRAGHLQDALDAYTKAEELLR